jgi:hypothetical protein
MVGQHDFEQRDTPSVFRKAMANTHPADGIPQSARLIPANGTAGRARDIVLRRFRQHFEFAQYHFVHLFTKERFLPENKKRKPENHTGVLKKDFFSYQTGGLS